VGVYSLLEEWSGSIGPSRASGTRVRLSFMPNNKPSGLIRSDQYPNPLAQDPSRLHGCHLAQCLQSQNFNQDTGSSRRLRLLHNSLHRFFDGLFSKAKCAADFFVGVTFG
jgi:hypothetical protein